MIDQNRHYFVYIFFLLILSDCRIDLMIFGGNWLINFPKYFLPNLGPSSVPMKKFCQNIHVAINRQTISLYPNSSVCRNTQDNSNWDRNPANFTLDMLSNC